jgi:drug/metabolite transporter (DMT)-like permease
MGVLLIGSASFLISIGSYLIAHAFSGQASSALAGSGLAAFSPRVYLFCLGVGLNLAGSACWAFGRNAMPSYVFAWNLYLVLLIAFGVLVAACLEREKITMSQYFGVALAAAAILMMSKK